MSLNVVNVPVRRLARVPTSTGGYTEAQNAIEGSPFPARCYRKPELTIPRDEANPGIATVDPMRAVSFLSPAPAVLVNDLVLLPDGVVGKIVRVRAYDDRTQCDLETGANIPWA